MKAIIMAGGKGTRLAPYTAVLPKPLMPIGDKPILELLLMQLKQHGVEEIVLAVNHLSNLIHSFFGDGTRLGLAVSYSYEDSPLGTAGPLGAVLENMGDHFFLLNGDLLTTLDFSRMRTYHLGRNAAATIATHERTLQSNFGVLKVSSDGRLEGYQEKPKYKHFVSMGCYVLSQKAVRGLVLPEVYMDMPDLMQRLLDAGQPVNCFTEPCFWLDIGRPDDYAQAQELYTKDASFFLRKLNA